LIGSLGKPRQCGQDALNKLVYFVFIELTQLRFGDVWAYRVDEKMEADHDIAMFRRITHISLPTKPGKHLDAFQDQPQEGTR